MNASTFSGFRALSRRGNVVPVWREIPADCLTPVMAYLLTAHGRPRAFLLESVEGGERFGRYSFVGSVPYRTLTARNRDIVERDNGRTRRERGSFLERMRDHLEGMHPVSVRGLPRFTGGAVGYIAYDAVRLFERLPGGGAPARPDLPDAWFGFYDTILAFDHLRQSILLITSAMTDRNGGTLRAQYEKASRRLDRLGSALRRRVAVRLFLAGTPRRRRSTAPGVRSNLTRATFHRMVETAKERIRAGEIYQVVLSQRFKRRLSCDPFAVYRALRRINPSPYMYFVRDGRRVLAGASPEMLVRIEDGRVEVHPIAGTRPRGSDPSEDGILEEDLRADPKERAEHVMLVDLARNDLGRVCRAGTVEVPEFMTVERFSHVMHLVSRVTGRLNEGCDAFDALRAAFPAGTVSGAPKIRAMEIIDELEPARRGAYAGVVCYIDHSGSLDSCLTIRTMVATGREAYVQAGSGIVADSDPEREYQESRNKARAVLAAIEGAASWA